MYKLRTILSGTRGTLLSWFSVQDILTFPPFFSILGPGLPPGPTYALVAQQESAPRIRGMLSGASPGQGYDGGETLYRTPYAPMGPAKGHGVRPCHGAVRGDCDYPQCADTDKTAAPGGACRDGIHLYAECKGRNPTRNHGNSGEGVAAQYRLSAPTGRPEKRREQLFVEP